MQISTIRHFKNKINDEKNPKTTNFFQPIAHRLYGYKKRAILFREILKTVKEEKSIYKEKLFVRKMCSLLSTRNVANGEFVQILSSSRHKHFRHISKSILLAIQSSSDFIRITNPYIIPPLSIQSALLQALSRGVKVAIITTGPTDVKLVKLASQIFLSNLVKRGAKIYELQNKVLHAKTIVIDGAYCSLGSFNFDDWSSKRNLEMNVTAVSTKSASVYFKIFYSSKLIICPKKKHFIICPKNKKDIIEAF
ncbi:hypothetical protein MHBO_002958 [Bonamia ostreae]|uniref:PLD phosphodiesterase domain-containing protein n=1 Tax=Bonamia ostreae TaxID=126728 RepID=A0ABV2AQ12_9EUKA